MGIAAHAFARLFVDAGQDRPGLDAEADERAGLELLGAA